MRRGSAIGGTTPVSGTLLPLLSASGVTPSLFISVNVVPDGNVLPERVTS